MALREQVERIYAGLRKQRELRAARGRLITVGRHTYGHKKITLRYWDDRAALTIGSFCSIAEGVKVFLGGNHRVDWVTTYPFSEFGYRWKTGRGIEGHPTTNGDVMIGSDVWIGAGATIVSGVTVGDGAVVAGQSVVTRDVEPYSIVAGNPAQLIRHRFPPEQVEQLLRIAWWEWSDERIEAAVPALMDDDIERFIQVYGDAGKE
jgi:chloramphenicol O-acetyltransferase type B